MEHFENVTNLERHRDLADRETDGVVHWNSSCPKLRHAFQSEGAETLSDSQCIDDISTKEESRPDFNIAKNTQTTTSGMFAPFKGTQKKRSLLLN